MRLDEVLNFLAKLSKYVSLPLTFCFLLHTPLATHAATESQQMLKDRIAEIGLEATIVEMVEVFKQRLPYVDPSTFESGETWTARDAAAWKDSIHWFIHSDSENPDLMDFLVTKFDHQCVGLEGFFVNNNVTIRYHLFDANQVPIFGFKLDRSSCENYIASE